MSITNFYLVSLGVILIGYAIFDKGFAYLGFPPIFIGEIFIGFSLFILLVSGVSARPFKSRIVWVLGAFVAWGAVRTIPFIGIYGLDALRDAVVWGYSLFAIFVAAAFLRCRDLALAPRWFGAWFPWFLVISPLFYILTQKFAAYIPTYPISGLGIIHMKPGDMAVHLAGIGAFMALGLHRHFMKNGEAMSQVKEFALWTLWGIDVIAAGSRNRGGLLSVLVVCTLILVFKPMSRINRVVLPLLIVVVISFAFDVKLPIGGGRTASVQQIYDNVESIVMRSEKTGLNETESWRLIWWKKIEDETIFGKYFWGGRGYGVNLAQVHSFSDGTGNRSPHNGHLTILARSGVPGILLWLVLIGCIAYYLLQGHYRMRSLGRSTYANINLWVAFYGVAFLVNGSFDVYLEGPQGGIWFWCVVGYAIALTTEQNLLYADAISKQQRVEYGVAAGRLR